MRDVKAGANEKLKRVCTKKFEKSMPKTAFGCPCNSI